MSGCPMDCCFTKQFIAEFWTIWLFHSRKYKEDIERFIAELVEKDKSDPDSLPRIHPLVSSSMCTNLYGNTST